MNEMIWRATSNIYQYAKGRLDLPVEQLLNMPIGEIIGIFTGALLGYVFSVKKAGGFDQVYNDKNVSFIQRSKIALKGVIPGGIIGAVIGRVAENTIKNLH